MQITIHRGTKEVGGTCVELTSGDSRIVVDIGMPLFAVDRNALNTYELQKASTQELREQGILPNVDGLFEPGARIDGILISHAHMDHTGLLDRSRSEIPVYASSGTSKMMLAGKLFARQVGLDRDRHQPVKPETPVTCRRRSENVAPGGEWPPDEKRSAQMITCGSHFRLSEFPKSSELACRGRQGCSPTWISGLRFAVAF